MPCLSRKQQKARKEHLDNNAEDIYELLMKKGWTAKQLAEHYEVPEQFMTWFIRERSMLSTTPYSFIEDIINVGTLVKEGVHRDMSIGYLRRPNTEGLYLISSSAMEYLMLQLGRERVMEVLNEL